MLVYPFVLCGLAILASLLGIGWVNFIKLKATPALVGGVAVSGLAAAADKCPISGKPADSSITSKGKDGKTVAFCCEKCKAKFDAKNK